MTLADPVTLGPPDFQRVQWGRPLVQPPAGDGRPRPYTRSSSAAKVVADSWNLELWARRNVAYGMARDVSLIARVLALGGEPSAWDLDTKQACNQIVLDAALVAAAHRAADIGTAVHRMTELADRGQPVEAGPWEADLEAYANALIAAGLTVVDVECRLVCDDLEMAGTADRILRRVDDGHVIADIKTGETVDYGGLGWAAQLAAYAHSEFYDVDSGKRTPLPNVDQTTGLIIHLPAGQGRCDLYEIDLVAGYRAAQLADEIRAVRRQAKRWISPMGGTSPTPATLPAAGAGDRRTTLRDRYTRLDPIRQTAFRAKGIDAENLDAIEAALDELEPVAVDEAFLASPTVTALNEALITVTPEHKAWLDVTARDALAAGHCISFRFEPFERNLAVCRALLAACQAGLTDDDVRALVAAVTGVEIQSTVTLGAVLGVLTIAEAQRLDEMAQGAIP